MTGVLQQMPPSGMWRVDLRFSVRAFAVLGGLVVIGLALIQLLLGVAPKDLFAATKDMLGVLFMTLAVGLVLTVMIAVARVRDAKLDSQSKSVWLHIGLHAANGIATVALTFTLFGISTGIGELAASDLNIDTINMVITSLTDRFSMAFMTSVVGLPLSALMRVVVGVVGKRQGF
jgi:hypothetical protein